MPTTTLFLDGIWGRPKRFSRMRKIVEECGGPTEIFPYDCSGIGCLEEEGRKLAHAVKLRGEPVNIVGFSMGGLVVRAAALADPNIQYRRAVFINSPHRGSYLSYLLPFPKLRGIQQLRPESDLLRRLNAAAWNIPTLAVWCPLDLMILPGKNARWDKANQLIRCDIPVHTWPIHSPSIQRRITAFLQ